MDGTVTRFGPVSHLKKKEKERTDDDTQNMIRWLPRRAAVPRVKYARIRRRLTRVLVSCDMRGAETASSTGGIPGQSASHPRRKVGAAVTKPWSLGRLIYKASERFRLDHFHTRRLLAR